MSEIEQGTPPVENPGVSPWADSWRRLKKNHMAMVGLWVVVAIALLSTLAPWVAPFDATYEFTWIGSQAPGFENPHAKAKNALSVGQDPELPPDYASAEQVTYRVLETADAIFRVELDRNDSSKIGLIKRQQGAVRIERLEAPAEGTYYLDRTGGKNGQALTDLSFAVGDSVPEAIRPENPRDSVIILVHVTPQREFLVSAQLAGGVVESMTRDGEPLKAIEFDGRHVLEVTADGDPQVATFWLGTDNKGRDVLSRTLWGGRISLLVGLIATLVSLVIGVVYGAVSGYAGGNTDMILMAIVDILYGIPYLFLVILLMVTFGRDILILFVALGAVQWLTMARIVRGQVLSLKQKEFVEAAVMSGSGPFKILFSHLVPNTLGVVVVYTTLTVPAVILQESFLAFIGLTVEYEGTSMESWGALINQGRQALGDGGAHWWQLIFPSLAMAATLFSLNFLGDGLRDAFDPQQRGRT